jgi:hypothetical protein
MRFRNALPRKNALVSNGLYESEEGEVAAVDGWILERCERAYPGLSALGTGMQFWPIKVIAWP